MITEEWLRNLAVREGTPHKIDPMGRMVMRWREMEPDVKKIFEDLMRK